ncbi:TonB-dependent siderophore receptor, partial [Ottowia sp.]|uniref:TonB-dependent siderophore receptor n=1 Tax=Ottowia sp. TaxID=1898956 RepID=UPI0039E514D9
GRQAPAVKGTLTVQQALAQLLAGSGLEGARQGDAIVVKAAAPAASAGEGASLAEVTVTAQADRPGDLPAPYAGGQVARGGRVGMLGNKDVMDTPFSITSYTRQLIEDQQAKTLADVLINDSSISLNNPSGAGYEDINIRGFRSDATLASFTFNGLTGLLPYQIVGVGFAERVEVLHGPSALINGMPTGNAIGGTINYVPKRAQDEPSASLAARYASRSQVGVAADLGQRFGSDKQFGIRFNGDYRDGGLPIRPISEKLATGVLGLDWRGEGVRLSADVGRQVLNVDSSNRFLSLYPGLDLPTPPSNKHSFLPSWTYEYLGSSFGMVRADVDLSRSVTAYAAFGMNESASKGTYFGPVIRNSLGDFVAVPISQDRVTRTQSGLAGLRAQFSTGAVAHTLMLNAAAVKNDAEYALAYDAQNQFTSNLYAPVDVPDISLPTGERGKASDGQNASLGIADTLSILDDRVQLTLGVRRQRVESRSFNRSSGAQTSAYSAGAWSPGAALVVRPRGDLTFYVNAVQGLQSGLIVPSGFANAGQVFPPYKSIQYEAGVKKEWSGSLMTTLSVFQITQPSFQLSTGTSLRRYDLDGEQRNRGIELNVFGEPVRGLRLNAGLTAIDARLTKTVSGTNDGHRAAGIAPMQATLGGEWDVPSMQGLTLTGRARHSGRAYLDAANTLTVPAWTELDVGARYTMRSPWNSKPLVVRLNINNLLDKNHWIAIAQGGLNLSLPRSVALSITYNF